MSLVMPLMAGDDIPAGYGRVREGVEIALSGNPCEGPGPAGFGRVAEFPFMTYLWLGVAIIGATILFTAFRLG